MSDTVLVVSAVSVAFFFIALGIWFYARGQHTRAGRAVEAFVGRVLVTVFLLAIVVQAFQRIGVYLAAHPDSRAIAWSIVAAVVGLAVATLFVNLARRLRRLFWYAAVAICALVWLSWIAAAVVMGLSLLLELIFAIHRLASTIERSSSEVHDLHSSREER